MTGHVRDCGAKALSYTCKIPLYPIKRWLTTKFGDFQLTGKQMREVMTELGWTWTHTPDRMDVPDFALVVTRRGFYGVVNGIPNMSISAPQCGFYTLETKTEDGEDHEDGKTTETIGVEELQCSQSSSQSSS